MRATVASGRVEIGAEYVVKLYARRRRTKSEVLEVISRASAAHVVQLYESGYADRHWFEVIEYAPAGSLRRLINDDGPKLSADAVTAILRELQPALVHIHSQEVVHRDLKPDNVLLRRRHPLDLMLTDFGASSFLDAEWRVSAGAVLTPYYTSPEALSDIVTPATDYWALGIMVVEMLNGAHPFANEPRDAVWHRLTTEKIDVSMLDRDWQLLCSGLLTRNHTHRWGANELERWLNGDRTIEVLREEESFRPDWPPFPFAGKEYPTPAELGPAMAANWDEARRRWDDGTLDRWLMKVVDRDLKLDQFLRDLTRLDRRGPDSKLFRFITYVAPNLPPSYCGHQLDEPSLIALATQAMNGNESEGWILETLYDGRCLSAYAEITGRPGLDALEQDWRRAFIRFENQRKAAIAAGMPADMAMPKSGERLGAMFFLPRAPQARDAMVREFDEQRAECRRVAPWFAALERLDLSDPPTLFLMASAAHALRVQSRRPIQVEAETFRRQATDASTLVGRLQAQIREAEVELRSHADALNGPRFKNFLKGLLVGAGIGLVSACIVGIFNNSWVDPVWGMVTLGTGIFFWFQPVEGEIGRRAAACRERIRTARRGIVEARRTRARSAKELSDLERRFLHLGGDAAQWIRIDVDDVPAAAGYGVNLDWRLFLDALTASRPVVIAVATGLLLIATIYGLVSTWRSDAPIAPIVTAEPPVTPGPQPQTPPTEQPTVPQVGPTAEGPKVVSGQPGQSTADLTPVPRSADAYRACAGGEIGGSGFDERGVYGTYRCVQGPEGPKAVYGQLPGQATVELTPAPPSTEAETEYNRGAQFMDSGRIAQARAALEAAIAADPQFADAHYLLGRVLMEEKNLAGAVAEFETYIRLAPQGRFATQAKYILNQLQK